MRDRRRARPALPSHDEAPVEVRHHRALQGVPAHRRGRARRGRARSRAGDPARQDQAGDVGLRLPPDPELSDHAPADAQPGRSPHGDGGQGRHPVGLDRALLPLRRRGRDRHARAGDRRRRQEEGRCAGDVARRGAGVAARQDDADLPRRQGRGRRGRRLQRPAGGDRRSGRQCRRRRAVGQYRHPEAPDRAQRRGRLHRPDLGPDRGAPLLRRRARREVRPALRRQDRA